MIFIKNNNNVLPYLVVFSLVLQLAMVGLEWDKQYGY